MKDAHPEKPRAHRAIDPPAQWTPVPGDGLDQPTETPVSEATTTASPTNGRQRKRNPRASAGRPSFPGGNGVDQNLDPVIPGVAGLPLAQQPVRTPAEVARSFVARRRLSLWAGLVILAAILVAEVSALSPWTDPTTGQAPRLADPVGLAEVNPYGVNTFLHKEVDLYKKQQTLDKAQEMGAAWIKQQFPWAEIEFKKGYFYDDKNNQSSWQKFDDIVDMAQQRGLRIIARIDSAPDWARADPSMSQSDRANLPGPAFAKAPPSPGNLVNFGNFVKKFVERYKGRIGAIQVWNEPNLIGEWPTGVNAQYYTQLLQAAYIGAKSADPNIIVLAAPLATNNEKLADRGNLNEFDYLQAMYYAGAKNSFDAMSANAYGTSYPPEDPPSRQKLNFRRVELLRKVMQDNGDGGKAIWFNEYGWNASPSSITSIWGQVTPEQQADYTVRGIQYAREHWPWAGVFTIWYLRQVGDILPSQSEYYFALVNPDFVPSPAYRKIRGVTHTQDQVATPGQWGPVTPQVKAGPLWQLRLSRAVPGGIYIAPAANADNLVVAFEGTDVKLGLVPFSDTTSLTNTNPVNARYYLTVDGSSSGVAPDLPRDASGQAYIDIPAGGQATQVQVVRGLASEFHTAVHTLTIRVVKTDDTTQGVGGKDATTGGTGVSSPVPQAQLANLPGIGAITVEARRSYVLFTLLTVLLVAGITIEAYALWRFHPIVKAVPVSARRGAPGR
jgi:hypothetical protein